MGHTHCQDGGRIQREGEKKISFGKRRGRRGTYLTINRAGKGEKETALVLPRLGEGGNKGGEGHQNAS